METHIPPGPQAARHYGMDWLRIGAFALLIFYHVGMFYVPWDWHVKAPQIVERASTPMNFTNGWRLALLFLVSGYASAAMLAKRPAVGRFLLNRTARLLVPLLFAIIVVVPPQPWVELVGKHGYPHGFGHFWMRDYFRFGTLDGIVLPTWQHLWFVAYLWPYTLLLGLLAAMPEAMRHKARTVFERVFSQPVLLFCLPIGWQLLRSFVFWPGVGDTHDFFGDVQAHWIYIPAFLFGFALLGGESVWRTIAAAWKGSLFVGLAAYAVMAAIDWSYPGDAMPGQGLLDLFRFARAINAWCMIVALLGLADRLRTFDHPWRATLNEAVFPFYIVHQTLIVVMAWWCARAGLANAVSFPLLVAGTAAGCWLFYRIGRAIPVLRLLIGLRGWRISASPAGRDAASTAA